MLAKDEDDILLWKITNAVLHSILEMNIQNRGCLSHTRIKYPFPVHHGWVHISHRSIFLVS